MPSPQRVVVFKIEQGRRYEDQYGGFLETLRTAFEEGARIEGMPISWLPFFFYFDLDWGNVQPQFPQCQLQTATGMRDEWENALEAGIERSYVEMHCAARPELADAFYKAQRQWTRFAPLHKGEPCPVIVTTSNSFFGNEVVRFMERQASWTKPDHVRNCILVPCAADKPYPADVHKAVIDRLPDDTWHLIVCSGVVGIAVEELWGELPDYDAGIPNEWRLMQVASEYFGRHNYDRIILYMDFNSPALLRALAGVRNDNFRRTAIQFVLPVVFCQDYTDLRDPAWLARLDDAIRMEIPQ